MNTVYGAELMEGLDVEKLLILIPGAWIAETQMS